MSKNTWFSPLLLVTAALLGLVIYLNFPAEQEQQQHQRGGTTPVMVFTVNQQAFPVIVEALGTAKANEAVTITAQQSDIVEKILFDDGQVVEQGQLLLVMNDRQERARVNELQVNLDEAKRQLKRITNLAKESVASEQLLDEQQAKVKAINAQLESANAQLQQLEIRAPFSGRLGIRQVSLGAFIGPSDVITTLDDLARVKVDFSVAENHLPSVKLGQQVTAKSVAYPGKAFTGNISSIDSRVDPVTRAIQVRAIIDNPELALRPGMLLQINLQKQVLQTLVVPEKALIPNEDKQFLFVIEEGKAIQKEVKIGLRRPGEVQITQGLSAGEKVVIEGALRLQNGSAVNILQSNKD